MKMSTSPTREAHFHKIAFSDFGTILEATLMKKGSQNGTKMGSKVNQNIDAIFDSKNSGSWSPYCAKMEPKWDHKSRNFVVISGYPSKTPPRWPNGGQGVLKWSKNGAQREPN